MSHVIFSLNEYVICYGGIDLDMEQHYVTVTLCIGNESMPKIIIHDTISILVISNHNSSRVLLDKIASVYFI